MRKTIHDLLSLIDNLEESTAPIWGKMSSRHMVEHLILAVKMSNGKLNLTCSNPPEKIPLLKRFLLSERPLPKGFVNPAIGDKLLPLQYNTLLEAVEILKEEMKDYFEFFNCNPTAKLINVTFGDLNKDEWEIFHVKHLTHHLEQFGLIKD